MIKPYTAVGLIPTVRGIRTRADIKRNLEHLEHLVKAAAWLSSLDLPGDSFRQPVRRFPDRNDRSGVAHNRTFPFSWSRIG